MNHHEGIDRRALLKRGAAVGGIVWAAPVIDSFASPAFAQNGSGVPVQTSLSFVAVELQCTGAAGLPNGVYTVKWNKGDNNTFPGTRECGITTPSQGQCGPNLFQPTQAACPDPISASIDPVTQRVTITFPAGCTITDNVIKCGPGCDDGVVFSTTPTSVTYQECSN